MFDNVASSHHLLGSLHRTTFPSLTLGLSRASFLLRRAPLPCAPLRRRQAQALTLPTSVQSGLSTWHHDDNPDGKIVELHGNARFLLCSHCERISEAKRSDLIHMRRCRPRICSHCHTGHLRFKIMLYDDEEASLITPEDVWTRLEEDLEVTDMVLWVGISFEQVRHHSWGCPCQCSGLDRDPFGCAGVLIFLLSFTARRRAVKHA
jgi:hypothetical protein